MATIQRLRRQRANSRAIARQLGVPISTVTKTLCRLGLNRLKALDPPIPVVRYQRARPGELVHLDTKETRPQRGGRSPYHRVCYA